MSDLVEIFVTEIAEEVTINVTPNLIEVNVIKGVVPTNPITGTGTTNFLPKFTGASTLGNSALQEVNGNLGLGVTPSAWAAFRAFDINTVGTLAATTDRLQLAINSFWNGSAYVYKTSNFASRYDQTSGQHQWFISPSGTAGSAISFTQAMTLDASGRLGIGITATDARLDVLGTSDTADVVRIRKSSTGSRRGALGTQSGAGCLDLYNDSSALSIKLFAEGNSYFNGGNVGIGTTSPAQKLDVNGLINSTNGICVGGEGVSRFWTGTQAAYDAITTKVSTTVYLIT
jgi:hypothetical protein